MVTKRLSRKKKVTKMKPNKKKTRSIRGGASFNRTGLKDKKQNVGNSEAGVMASQLVLSEQEKKASKVLDEAVNATANQIRVGSKALAKVTQDPETMKSLAETIEAVGNAKEYTVHKTEKIGY